MTTMFLQLVTINAPLAGTLITTLATLVTRVTSFSTQNVMIYVHWVRTQTQQSTNVSYVMGIAHSAMGPITDPTVPLAQLVTTI